MPILPLSLKLPIKFSDCLTGTDLKSVVGPISDSGYSAKMATLPFWLNDDLSRTYTKIIRDRQGEVYDILNKIRIDLLKLLAPIIPKVKIIKYNI